METVGGVGFLDNYQSTTKATSSFCFVSFLFFFFFLILHTLGEENLAYKQIIGKCVVDSGGTG